MKASFDKRYPSIEDLRQKAKRRIPRFAFEYLDGGCNEDVNIKRNTSDLREVKLKPQYLKDFNGSSLKTKILGIEYDAPFGMAPIGLQGLMWPNSPEILASSSAKNNLPFVLSTVSTSSIERIADITEGKAWFQLYNPSSDEHRRDIIERVQQAQLPVLVILSDVPTFGFRPRDIKNGLSMPPRMSLQNIAQILTKPSWAVQTAIHGKPNFEVLKPYMKGSMSMKQLGQFMNQMFSGRLDSEKIKRIRDQWKGKLVVKGIESVDDAEMALQLGVDGIIVSNHGGRQLDAGESTISALKPLVEKFGSKMEIMMDSGIRSGPDIARSLASGAKFTFLGRAFMYGVAALGQKGGEHTVSLLQTQLQQIMEQLCCEKIEDLPKHLINDEHK